VSPALEEDASAKSVAVPPVRLVDQGLPPYSIRPWLIAAEYGFRYAFCCLDSSIPPPANERLVFEYRIRSDQCAVVVPDAACGDK